MAVEIEAKLKVEQLAPYNELLLQLGAQLQGSYEQFDTFYEQPEKKLLQAGSGLRLRREQGKNNCKNILCFKGPTQKSNYKRREEIQIEVNDANQVAILLDRLGYKPVLTVEKNRTVWNFNKCLVCLDEVNGLGSFVEIEGQTEDDISAVAVRLKLDQHVHIPLSYAKMISRRERNTAVETP
jgi:adenylate cyclase class 2